MMSLNDFEFKQILFVNAREGDKFKVDNDNIAIYDKEGNCRHKSTFYRLFILYIVGGFTITSSLIEKSKKFGFSVILMSYSFRFITVINNGLEGNYLLHRKQYENTSLLIGKEIIKRKFESQRYIFTSARSLDSKNLLVNIDYYASVLDDVEPDVGTYMAFEGLIAKQYFKAMFGDLGWNKRMPRTKVDPLNTTLDIGYTLLFSFVESILAVYDFDLYVGVLHRQFYKRKSLVCDIVEPFRYIIDYEVRKSWNLKKFKNDDFEFKNNCYYLKKEKTSVYTSVFLSALLKNKEMIFKFVQQYYRWFMKGEEIGKFPRVQYDDN